MEYWSWWIGALALGLFAVIYGLLTRKPLGVSGSWLRIANWRDDKDLQDAEAFFDNKDEAVDDLMAATMAEFGDDIASEIQNDVAVEKPAATVSKQPTTAPAGAHVVFLVSMFIGSFIATWLYGNFEVSFVLSETHTRIFGDTWEVWLSLLFGGMMVGFGTQMAGGCTSGHGLSGCAQFVPASLVSTMIFMSSAIVLSLFMKMTS